jgi:Uma2 family endonuclease
VFEPMPSKLFTADELFRMSADFELDRGVLVPVTPVGRAHGGPASRLIARLTDYVDDNDLGEVYTELGCVLERSPDTVRGPDVAFVSNERLAGMPAMTEDTGFYDGPPDLAVEVVATRDARSKAARKLPQYLASGCRLVWIVDSPRKRVDVHTPGKPVQTLSLHDTLEGEDVIPGFRLPVRDIFHRRTRQRLQR